MLLVHTDEGRAIIENLAAGDPSFDPLFFLQRSHLNLAADQYFQQVEVTAGGTSFTLQVRFFDRDNQKMIDGFEVFKTDGFAKIASVSYVEVPVAAGSLTYLDDKLYLTGANDRVYDGGGNDIVDLSDGDDIYHYAAGNDQVMGGNGWDVVVLTLPHADVTSARSGGDYTLTIANGDVVTLTDVERVEFADGATLAFDLGAWANAGAAYRLYQAAFDRVPDAGGLKYWIDALDDGGRDLTWVAANFINSAEFQQTYGTPGTVSDAAFVDLLYQNVLDRAAEGDGATYWQNELANGTDRALVLLSFSESAENQAKVAAAIDDGIWF
jgi:hypothetical protein